MIAPIYRSFPHAYRLNRCTVPGKRHTRETRIAITPRGNVIISRAFNIAINYLKQRELEDQKGENSRTERTMLEEMEEMLTSGIFINNDDEEHRRNLQLVFHNITETAK
jgi:hypothetical protein